METAKMVSLEELTNLHPHTKTLTDLYTILQSTEKGLSEKEARSRAGIFGLNKLEEKKQYSILSLVIGQFKNVLVLILVFAGMFSFIIGEQVDAYAIFSIVLINGVLGFIQEYKAEKSIEALKKIESLKARVIRDGKEYSIEAEYVVPGDVIALYEGDKIPADGRLIEEHYLEVDESMLTGESNSVGKREGQFEQNTPLADRRNMLFSGNVITKGKGRALVCATGMRTEIGQIAREISESTSMETPLQKALERLGKILAVICSVIVIPSLVLGLIMDRDFVQMVMISISLAVSSIPEGLPIIVTVTLALGIKRMAKVNVLIRRLASAETLGGIDIICTDKTGTLTHNQMTVNKIFIPEVGFYHVSGNGYDLEGKIRHDSEESNKFNLTSLSNAGSLKLNDFLESIVLCSDADAFYGDPTERALAVLLRKSGQDEEELRQINIRKSEIPFDSVKKFMGVTVGNQEKEMVIVKGASEVILSMCQLTTEEKQWLLEIDNYMSGSSLRVLAAARKNIHSKDEATHLKNFTFLGMVGMFDPPRDGVTEALKVCYEAGIRVIMITGDHKNTALAISHKIGLVTEGVVTGSEIDEMDDQQFEEAVKKINVYARVSPPHKVKILEALQKDGYLVGMTGDGVNDAPAVKKADVGISVGSGTDLTKSVSDMILLDDNFATISNGIKEGRRIFFNIKKFLLFLLSTNFDEVLAIFTCILLGLPLIFLPIQILWLNLVTDSFPALALSADTAEDDIMKHPPYKPSVEILRGIVPFIITAGGIAFIVSMGLFLGGLYVWKLPLEYVRTLTFSTTVLFKLFFVFAVRSNKSAFKKGIFNNVYLWLAVGVGVLMQFFVVYHPIAQRVFLTVPLHPKDWIIVLLCALSGFTVIEIIKVVRHGLGVVSYKRPVS